MMKPTSSHLLARQFLAVALFLLVCSLPALAQDCRCCKTRSDGQALYDKGRYAEAKTIWLAAKELSDAGSKCKDLDALITKAQKKINQVEAAAIAEAQKKRNKAAAVARRKREAEDAVKKRLRDEAAAAEQRRREKQKSTFTMKRVVGSTYTMGSPTTEATRSKHECQHSVTVATFSIGQTEVTQAQWKAVMGGNPSNFKGDNLPVENVSWNDVQDFIKKLNQMLPAGQKPYRLPTEAEWEYAAGGGASNRTKYAGTSNDSELSKYANFCDSKCPYGWSDNQQTDGYQNTSPVGSFMPNALGLYDMSGNVCEWCQDLDSPNPSCPASYKTASGRAIRGGGWDDYGSFCRSAKRSYVKPDLKDFHFGFRLAHD